MPVTPADFELYSRATGTPMPRTPQEQMQLAPAVHQFIQNKGYQQGGLLDNPIAAALGSTALMAGAYAAAKALGGRGSDDSGAVSTDIDPKTPSPTDNVGVTGSLVKNLSPTSSEIQWSSPGTTDLGLNVQVVNPLSNDGRLLVSEPFQKEARGEFNVVQPKAFGRPDVDLGFPRPLSPGMQGVGEKVRAIWQRPTFTGHEHHKNLLESVGGALATAGLDATAPELGVPLHVARMAGGALGNIAPALDFGARGLETAGTVGLAAIDQATGDVIDTARLLAGPGVALARKGYDDVTTYVPEYYEKYGKPVVDYAVGRAVEDTGKVVNYAKQRAAQDTQLALNFVDAYLNPEVEQGQSLLTEGNPQRDETLIEGDQTNTSPGRGIHNPDIDDPWENEGIGLGAQVDSTPTDAVTQSWEDRGEEMPVVQTLSTDEGDVVIHKHDPDNVLEEGQQVDDRGDALYKRGLRDQAIDNLVTTVLSEPRPGFEAYQEFEPKAAKKVPYISKVTGKPTGALMDAGGGTGVEYIGLQDDGDTFMQVGWHNKNPEKKTPGGYVFDSYQDATGPSHRDALVTPVADSRITSGATGDQGMGTTVSDEVMDEKLARDAVEEENYETVKDWLDTGKFGYGEDQVSPGKFAQRAKKSQATLSEFIAENKDRLEG